MVAHQPAASDVLARLDSRLTDPPYLLVAHNAPTEAGILYDYRDSCPTLATIDFLDTVRLARVIYPDLFSHRLDALINHFGIRRPADRHRALPDVEITTCCRTAERLPIPTNARSARLRHTPPSTRRRRQSAASYTMPADTTAGLRVSPEARRAARH